MIKRKKIYNYENIHPIIIFIIIETCIIKLQVCCREWREQNSHIPIKFIHNIIIKVCPFSGNTNFLQISLKLNYYFIMQGKRREKREQGRVRVFLFSSSAAFFGNGYLSFDFRMILFFNFVGFVVCKSGF